MLTKTQIAEAELATGETPNTKLQTPILHPKLDVTCALERESASHLGQAVHYLERGERGMARKSIGRAIEKLNEAEIED